MTVLPPKYLFEQARKLYPGKKRGFDFEWDNFYKKYRTKINEITPLLKPAIEAQIARREVLKRKKEFVPPWKHFKTWINGGWWTEDIPQTDKPKVRKCCICGQADVVSQTSGKGWRCWREKCKVEYAKL